jgi:hypothetical protein
VLVVDAGGYIEMAPAVEQQQQQVVQQVPMLGQVPPQGAGQQAAAAAAHQQQEAVADAPVQEGRGCRRNARIPQRFTA